MGKILIVGAFMLALTVRLAILAGLIYAAVCVVKCAWGG